MILLQIVMVSPGTHLEKYHESLSRTNESQFKNKESLGLYVTTRLIWQQTPKLCITVYWNKNISFYYQAQQKLKEIWVLRQQPQEQPLKSHKQDILQKHFTKTSSDQSINLCVLWDAYQKLFCIFGNFYESGTQGAEVTKSLENLQNDLWSLNKSNSFINSLKKCTCECMDISLENLFFDIRAEKLKIVWVQ